MYGKYSTSAAAEGAAPAPELHLEPEHAELLRASAIADDVARERGYASLDSGAANVERLRGLGFEEHQCRLPGLLIPIHGVDGMVVLHQYRPDHPRVDERGRPVKYESPARAPAALDVPPRVRPQLADPGVPLVITEGARKVDAAVSQGLCCVGLQGVFNFRGRNAHGGVAELGDWEAVALRRVGGGECRTVYLAFDSDAATNAQVRRAEARLRALLERRGARVVVLRLPPDPGGAKVGLDDWLAQGHDADELLALPTEDEDEASGPRPARRSQATRLVELVADAGVELFHTPDDSGYATVPVGDHRETWPLRSGGFRRWLERQFYAREGGAPGGQAVADALGVLEGQARYDGPALPVHLRTAPGDVGIYLDLCDEEWNVVAIDPTGWRVIPGAEAPVKFRRAKGMLPLPRPMRGGTLDELRPFVNVAGDDDWALVIAWLLAAARPTGPYWLLDLTAEQGSGKSMSTRALRRVLDPHTLPLRAEPRDERDLAIAAANNRVVAWDNLSGLAPWLSDALCRLSTGGGLATRQLYTDSEEALFDVMRPAVLNGIGELASRPDLLDRTVVVTLPPLRDEKRWTEAAYWRAFEAAHPRVLGALCDAVSGTLRALPGVRLPDPPRMADCATWVTAAEGALGWEAGRFLAAYRRNREAVNDGTLEANPVAQAVIGLVGRLGSDLPWEGTVQELRERLGDVVEIEDRVGRAWPQTPRGLATALRRVAPNLRRRAIAVAFTGREGGTGRTLVRLSRMEGM